MHESFLCTFKSHLLLALADCEIFVQIKTAMTAVQKKSKLSSGKVTWQLVDRISLKFSDFRQHE